MEGITIHEITRRTADGLVVSGSPWRESYRPAGFLHGGAVASLVASSALAAARELTGQPALCLRSMRLAYFAPSAGAMVEVDAAVIGRYGTGAALAVQVTDGAGTVQSAATVCCELAPDSPGIAPGEPDVSWSELTAASHSAAAARSMQSEAWRRHLGIRADAAGERCAISSAEPRGEWPSIATVCTVADTVGVLMDQFRSAERDFVTVELTLEQFRPAVGSVAAEGRLVRQTGRLTSLVSALYDRHGLLGIGGATYSAIRGPGSARLRSEVPAS